MKQRKGKWQLATVLTVTWGGSSLKAEEWSDGSEETVIWQDRKHRRKGYSIGIQKGLSMYRIIERK